MKYLSRGFKLNLGFKIWYTFGAVPLHELRDSIRFSAQVSGGVGARMSPTYSERKPSSAVYEVRVLISNNKGER